MHDNSYHYQISDSCFKKRSLPEPLKMSEYKKAKKHKKDDNFSLLHDEFGPDLAKEYLRDLDLGCSSLIILDDVISPLNLGN